MLGSQLSGSKIGEALDIHALKNINSNLLTPSSLLWEFSGLLEKKLYQYNNVSNVRLINTNHKYFVEHVSYLTILFKIHEPKKSISLISKDINQLISEAINETKVGLIEVHKRKTKNLKELISLENETLLKKVVNLKTVLSKDPEIKTNSEKDTSINNLINNLNIGSKPESEKVKFDILNFCLETKKLSILETCIDLTKKTLSQKYNVITNDLNRLGTKIKDENFSIIKPINVHTVKIYEEESNYMYLAYFVISLIISIFFVLVSELITKKK